MKPCVKPFEDVIKEPEHLDYENRITEDGYVTIQEQIARFTAAGDAMRLPEDFDTVDDNEIDSDMIMPVYSADPVEMQAQYEQVSARLKEKYKPVENPPAEPQKQAVTEQAVTEQAVTEPEKSVE